MASLFQDDAFFKIRPTKRSNPEERTTLDVLHQHQLRKIQNEQEDVLNIDKEIQMLQLCIEQCKDELERGQMTLKLESLQKQKHVKSDEKRIFDYYLDTGDLLFQYYDIQESISKGEQHGIVQKNKRKPGDVLSALEEAAIQDISENNIIVNPNPVVKATPGKKKEKYVGRDDLLDKYMQKINPAHMKRNSEIQDNLGECSECGEDMIFSPNEAMLYCKECRNTEFILIDSDRPSYKDPPRESSYYAYKRINHFKELLAQFQAKETKDIKPEIIEAIEAQLHKEQITDFKNLKPSKLREVLKKLKLNRLYDNISHIINRLNKNNAPVMDRDTEERLRHMFIEIQPSFQRHCPKNRRNFLSYSYVLYKFCELLELDDFLKCFPLLKNRDKLYLQDKVWQQICADMNWEFIRSI